jgi:D-alanyl-D-alanine carboxypeptidase (penicillin-binding protein 5/6)
MLRDGVDMLLLHRAHKLILILLSLFISISFIKPVSMAEGFGVSAKGAILIEQESGRVLFEKDAHTQMRIASITKIMTAILAIESGKLNEKVNISNRAAGTEGSSIYLEAGEKEILEELVYGLMLRSGNDSAVAIAEHVGGSLEGFVYMMNQKAQEIGMSKTVFSNPHGLDDHEEHYSTAYDMAILTQYAMRNETFRKIFGTERYGNWENKNRLLTELYKYSTGGKTGYTKRAKRTLVSTAEKDGMSLIAVTINAPSDWNDHMSMFNRAFNTYDLVTIANSGKLEKIRSEFYKGKVELVRNLTYPLTKKERSEVTQSMTFYKPPEDGKWDIEDIPSPVGKLKIYLGNEVIANLPIYLNGTAKVYDEPTFIDSIKDVISKFLFVGLFHSIENEINGTEMFWDDQFYG